MAEHNYGNGDRLVLRGSLSPGSRRAYAEALAGSPLSREDAWQRAVELLFEHLAVRWEVAGVVYEKPAELLARYRMAAPEERRAVREALRTHVAERFPELEPP